MNQVPTIIATSQDARGHWSVLLSDNTAFTLNHLVGVNHFHGFYRTEVEGILRRQKSQIDAKDFQIRELESSNRTLYAIANKQKGQLITLSGQAALSNILLGVANHTITEERQTHALIEADLRKKLDEANRQVEALQEKSQRRKAMLNDLYGIVANCTDLKAKAKALKAMEPALVVA